MKAPLEFSPVLHAGRSLASYSLTEGVHPSAVWINASGMQGSVSSPAVHIQLSHLSSQLKGLGSSAAVKAHLTPFCKWHHLIYHTIWVLACAASIFSPPVSLSSNENSLGIKYWSYVLHHKAKMCSNDIILCNIYFIMNKNIQNDIWLHIYWVLY